MTTFIITFITLTVIVFLLWLFLMFKMRPSRKYPHEDFFAANKREGGYQVLIVFLILALFASIGIARLILWFTFLEK